MKIRFYCAVCGERLIEACPNCEEKTKNPTDRCWVWDKIINEIEINH